MEYRTLGRTNLSVSSISLGTVALGLDYGIAAPGNFGRPDPEAALRLLQEAREAGINFFDTAPAYGSSEALLGQALGNDPGCIIATKVSIPPENDPCWADAGRLKGTLRASLQKSLRRLNREVLDVVQLHNPTPEILGRWELLEVLLEARQRGMVRFLGASVYGEAAAQAVLAAGCFEVLQVAFNLLDQRLSRRIFPAAQQQGVALVVRSAFLKGVLTQKARWLPPELLPLRKAVARTRRLLHVSWEGLPELALRYCLSVPGPSTVLVGVRTSPELGQALQALRAGTLSDSCLQQARSLGLKEERWLNPSLWPLP